MDKNPAVITQIQNSLSKLELNSENTKEKSNEMINTVRTSVIEFYKNSNEKTYCKTPIEKDKKESEFLWDITVISEDTFKTYGTDITFKKSILFACEIENLWQPSEVLHDFSKLIFCNAPIRLFLGGIHPSGDASITRQLGYLKSAYKSNISEAKDEGESEIEEKVGEDIGEIWVGFYISPKKATDSLGNVEIKQLKDWLSSSTE